MTEGEGDQSLPTIRRGDRGETVTTLQTALNDQGYDCGEVDGIYGRKTKAAVEAFQRAHSLKVDGICGRQTWTALGLMEAPVYADGTQPPDFKQYDYFSKSSAAGVFFRREFWYIKSLQLYFSSK